MEKSRPSVALADEAIASRIYVIRGLKVMIDHDLAELYQVPTKRLNEQVRRNLDRFPGDFMFQLTEQEFEILRSQIATSRWGGRRIAPYAFTEHGVLMLSSVLNSERAININIQIMRIYNKTREMLLTHKDILLKLEQLENRAGSHDKDIKKIFTYLKQFLIPAQQVNRQRIGFKKQG